MGTCVTEIDDMLDSWEELCNEATEGPWDAPKDVRSGSYYIVKTQADVSHYRTSDICGMPLACPDDCIDNGYDARFIAAARTAMPQLIKAVRYLRKRLEKAYTDNNDDMIEQGAKIKQLESEVCRLNQNNQLLLDQGREDHEHMIELHAEAYWLAHRASKMWGCVKPENMKNAVCSGKLPQEVTLDDCINCWRKQARKAVQDD